MSREGVLKKGLSPERSFELFTQLQVACIRQAVNPHDQSEVLAWIKKNGHVLRTFFEQSDVVRLERNWRYASPQERGKIVKSILTKITSSKKKRAARGGS